MYKICIYSLLLIILIHSSIINAQNNSELWKPINYSSEKNIYIDLAGLEHFTKDDVYVWVLEEFTDPFELESSNDQIFTSKTYYLLNKKLNMYSILEIIYYNEKDAITEYYNYWRETDIESYKYNYPIMPGSVEESILTNCMGYIDKQNSMTK